MIQSKLRLNQFKEEEKFNGLNLDHTQSPH